jgi:hypothetical protein
VMADVPVTANFPALTVALARLLFVPAKVRVPVPCLVIVPSLDAPPETAPLSVRLLASVSMIAPAATVSATSDVMAAVVVSLLEPMSREP